MLAAGLLTAAASPASGATSVTVYVSQAGRASTGCSSPGTGACGTIAEGIAAAELLMGSRVVVEVAASHTPYLENLTIDDVTSDNPTLTIRGAGAATTTLDGPVTTSSDVAVDAGDVTISGLSIINGGEVENVGGTGVANGGGVDNSATLTLTDDTLADDWATNDGGAVYNGGTLRLESDILLSDTATGSGGGVFNSLGATATIADDTLSGDAATDGTGGGVSNGGVATLTDDLLAGDVASQAGGVSNSGTATLTGDTITGDGGGGVMNTGIANLTADEVSDDTDGGVFNSGTASLTDDTLAGDSDGAMINSKTAQLTDDTLSGDSGVEGGALSNDAGATATLTDDTVSGDSADLGGAFINNGTLALTDDTLSGDSAGLGGGIFNFGSGSIRITASILDSAGCYNQASGSAIQDGGYNVESDDSCGLGAKSRVNSSAIGLATTLAANESQGPETLAIGPGSSAFEEVPSSACTVRRDERGRHRPGYFGRSSCDAGAYEFQTSLPSAPRHLRARPENGSISLTWGAPTSTGGLRISGYRVFCSSTRPVSTRGTPTAKVTASTTSAKAGGLKNGTRYYCVVIAVNAEGDSPASSMIAATPRVAR